MVRSPFANGLLKKISSGTKRQLTVHLYRNCREKSKAPVRYSQGCSNKNGRPRRPCKATMAATCPIVVSRPFLLQTNTMIPGRYSIFDILTDRAPLDWASAWGLDRDYTWRDARVKDRPNLQEPAAIGEDGGLGADNRPAIIKQP